MLKLLSISSIFLASLTTAVASESPLAAVLPETLYNTKGEPVTLESLEGKMVGIYFTASWCPPCRGFTPSIVELRNAHHDDFEVVLVGFDRSPEAHEAYRENYNMEFPAVEFRSEAAQALAEKFGVRGIPHLVVLGPDGSVISENGVPDVRRDAPNAFAGWKSAGTQ